MNFIYPFILLTNYHRRKFSIIYAVSCDGRSDNYRDDELRRRKRATACRNIGKFVSNSVIVSRRGTSRKYTHTHKVGRLALEVVRVPQELLWLPTWVKYFRILIELPKLKKAIKRKKVPKETDLDQHHLPFLWLSEAETCFLFPPPPPLYIYTTWASSNLQRNEGFPSLAASLRSSLPNLYRT